MTGSKVGYAEVGRGSSVKKALDVGKDNAVGIVHMATDLVDVFVKEAYDTDRGVVQARIAHGIDQGAAHVGESAVEDFGISLAEVGHQGARRRGEAIGAAAGDEGCHGQKRGAVGSGGGAHVGGRLPEGGRGDAEATENGENGVGIGQHLAEQRRGSVRRR